MYTFTLSVFKDYSSIGLSITLPANESSIVVDVQCTLKGFEGKSIPPPDPSGLVELGINKVLKIDISLEAGEDAQFEADWGDGSVKSTNSLPDRTPPYSFPFEHTYTVGGNYTITLLVKNSQRTLDPIIIPILISQCTFPEVTFSYGTKAQPTIRTRGQIIQLDAKYKFTTEKCADEQADKFNVIGWKLVKMIDDGNLLGTTNETVSDSFAVKSFDRSIKKCSYKIPALSLREALYVVTLTVDDSTKRKDYFAYLNVKQTPLFVEIENGDEREIAAFKLDENDNQVFIDFAVDAAISIPFGKVVPSVR